MLIKSKFGFVSFGNDNKVLNYLNIKNNYKMLNDYKISYKDEEYVTKNSQNNDSTINKRNIISIKNNNNEKSALDIESKLNDISNKEWEEIKTMAMRLKRILMLELVLTIYLKTV